MFFYKTVQFTVKKDGLVDVLDAILEYGKVEVKAHKEAKLYIVSVTCPSSSCTSYVNRLIELSRNGLMLWNLQIE